MSFKASYRLVQIIMGIIGVILYFITDYKEVELIGIVIIMWANGLSFQLYERLK